MLNVVYKFTLSIFACLWLTFPSDSEARGTSHGGRYIPGSARLELAAVREVVAPEGASEKLQAAVADLRDVWAERVPGAAGLELTTGEPPKFSIVLEYRDEPAWARLWRPWPVGSFTITRERSRVYIRAVGDAGLLNGVYALCHEVLGARWYWAGELGKTYVGQVPRFFPERRWWRRPAFVHRQLYPMNNDFGRRNRLVGGFSFNHNMAKIFTPKVYASDPEVFPVVRGVKKIPKGSGAYDAIPDLLNPRTVELAAEAALRHFNSNPKAVSFSLSINDNTNFDGQAHTREFFKEKEFYRRRPNYTDYVFGFMNAVAEKVFDEGGAWKTPSGEDRYLTSLAYFWTEQSPSFKLHSRVLPVLTSDRAQWHDPNYRADDRALIERWSRSGAKRIGTWDYYFGSPYPYPRQFNQWIIESLRHLSRNNVTVFFSQLPSAWGLDGGKAWLASRLLWNPKQDAQALLDEFYSNFFGPAGEFLRAFYEKAEAHRNAHEGEWYWIKHYHDEAAIELFPQSVLEELRSAIEAGRSVVPANSIYAKRIAVVSDAFRFSELYAELQSTRRQLTEASLMEALPLADKIQAFINARSAFNVYAETLLEDPMHERLEYFMQLKQSDPVPLALATAVRMGGSLEDLEVPDYAESLRIARLWVTQPESFVKSFLSDDLKHYPGFPKARDFFEPRVPAIQYWALSFRAAEHLKILPLTLNAGLRVENANYLSLYGDVALNNFRDFVVEFELDYQSGPDNRIYLQTLWKNDEKKTLRNDMLVRMPNNRSEQPRRFFIPVRSPEDATLVRIRLKTHSQYPGDYLKVSRAQLHALKPAWSAE